MIERREIASLDLRLAPMAGVTSAPFRLVARACGAGLLTTEEIDARALVMGNARTHALARGLPGERPLARQLLGADPEVLAEAARRLEADGAEAIDLNMGCPVPKVVAKGQGAALLRDPRRVATILRAMRAAIRVPLTIKIRGGWDDRTVNAPEIARVAETEGVDAIAVHPRTRSQRYAGPAPWQVIASVVAAVRLPVTGNGDVRSRADAAAMVRATRCAAVMIGRGALGAPWVFSPEPPDQQARAALIRRHVTLSLELLPDREALLHLKKHLAWYATGQPGAAALRPLLFQAPDAATALRLFWEHWVDGTPSPAMAAARPDDSRDWPA